MAAPATTSPAPVALGTPYRTEQSVKNTQAVLQAVWQRFPEWAQRCEPYVNVLTIRAWNVRGYRVKKGEHSIRVRVLIPAFTKDEKTGERVPAGTSVSTAHLFALPQVEKRA